MDPHEAFLSKAHALACTNEFCVNLPKQLSTLCHSVPRARATGTSRTRVGHTSACGASEVLAACGGSAPRGLVGVRAESINAQVLNVPT